MKKIIFLSVFSVLCLSDIHSIETPAEVTQEWLTSDPNEEHIVCFQEIFNQMKTRNMLEFGLGFSTKYFLESCKRVISVEVVTNGYGPERIKKFLSFYRDYPNWVPISYFSGYPGDMSWAPYKYMGSNAVYLAASYQCSTHLSYEPIDDFYLKELGEFIANLTKFNRIEVVFINPILFLRGDLIELCFHKIPIIVAHHTSSRFQGVKNDVYGYSRVKTPQEYEEIYIPTSQGTTVWILKEAQYQPLIDSLSQLSQ
jgi:hypothetical protein